MVFQEDRSSSNYVLVKGENKGIIEIKDSKQEEIIYTKIRQKVSGGTYVSRLFDPITQAMLAEVQGKKSSAKLKQLLLYQPDDCIELKDSGILSFEYKFFWEDEKYLWKKRGIVGRELECKMIHGDDPGIGVCMYKQDSKTLGCITIMHYNIERLKIKDRKGLEYLLLMSLLSILDKWDDDSIIKSKNEFVLSDDLDSEILKEDVKLPEEKGKEKDKEKEKREKEKKEKEKKEREKKEREKEKKEREREKEKEKEKKEREREREKEKEKKEREREKEKEKKKNRNKKELAEEAEEAEEAILQETLRQLKEQEKKDEEYARQLQKKLSDPNYNEEETSSYGESTANNSVQHTLTYSPDNSTVYNYVNESTYNDKRLRPPTPPSSYPSPTSKYTQNYSPNSSSEQEEYYRTRPPPPTPSPPPNLYPPPTWDLSYENTKNSPSMQMPSNSQPSNYYNGYNNNGRYN